MAGAGDPSNSTPLVGETMFDVGEKFGSYITEENLKCHLDINHYYEVGQTCFVVRARTIPPLLLENMQSMDGVVG